MMEKFRIGVTIYSCITCRTSRQYGFGLPEQPKRIVQLLCEGECLTLVTPHRFVGAERIDEYENKEATVQATE